MVDVNDDKDAAQLQRSGFKVRLESCTQGPPWTFSIRYINESLFRFSPTYLEIRELKSSKVRQRYQAAELLLQQRKTPVDQILEWIRICDVLHQTCERTESNGWRPCRLVDVAASLQDNLLRLIKGHDAASPRYITLSHRWGRLTKSCGRFVLSSFNEELMSNGFSPELLGKTFQDFVDFARRIGVRYIWIDLLCIKQDSIVDWRDQASEMGRVYENSYFNVAASASTGTDDGLHGVRSPGLGKAGLEIPLTRSRNHRKEFVINQNRRLADDMLLHEPLHRRGWVVQEVILASKVLFLASSQIVWRCRESCQGGLWNSSEYGSGTGVLSPELQNFQSSESIEELDMCWQSIVRVYAATDLTFETDRLIAISGLAERCLQTFEMRSCSTEYIAGIWRHNMIRGLLWYIGEWSRRPSKDYIAPSWSWASLSGDVRYLNVNMEDTESLQVLDVRTLPVDDRHVFGQLQHGYIHCRAPAFAAPLFRLQQNSPNHGNHFVGQKPLVGDVPFWNKNMSETRYYWDLKTPARTDQDVLFVVVLFNEWGFCAGWMLRKTTSLRHLDKEVYERLGLWETSITHLEPEELEEIDREAGSVKMPSESVLSAGDGVLADIERFNNKSAPRIRSKPEPTFNLEDQSQWQEVVII